MIDHIVRKGLSHASPAMVHIAGHENSKIEIPTWGSVLLSVTLWGSVLALVLVSYMLREVVATLCMVEAPAAAITVSPSSEPAPAKESPKEGLLETGPTITLVNQKPITSSIRATIRHLVEHAGRWSRFRGFKINILYGIVFSVVVSAFQAMIAFVPGSTFIAATLTGALLANLHASWTHKVVSMPNNKPFWQRVPARSNWKVLALPAAVESAMPYFSVYLVKGFIVIFGLDKIHESRFSEHSGAQWASLVFRILSVMVIGVACSLFLCLPATVTLIRVESSILPEDQDTIVPFDRTFAGKVVPKVLGGTGAIGFLDAWKSFNWEARWRLIKTYIKTFLVLTGMFLVLAHVLAFEVFAIMGPELGKFMAQVKQQQQGAQ